MWAPPNSPEVRVSSTMAPEGRPRAVSGEDLHVIRQREQLGVETLVEHAGELLRGEIGRKVGTANIANEERVAGEDREGVRGPLRIGDGDGDAFDRVAG